MSDLSISVAVFRVPQDAETCLANVKHIAPNCGAKINGWGRPRPYEHPYELTIVPGTPSWREAAQFARDFADALGDVERAHSVEEPWEAPTLTGRMSYDGMIANAPRSDTLSAIDSLDEAFVSRSWSAGRDVWEEVRKYMSRGSLPPASLVEAASVTRHDGIHEDPRTRAWILAGCRRSLTVRMKQLGASVGDLTRMARTPPRLRASVEGVQVCDITDSHSVAASKAELEQT